jgi:1-acyl-sn-glycerol-3-phosphate acyltransferase
MTHVLVRWLSRRALRWLYREIRYVGRSHVPRNGAVLLIGNHPNDLPDVLSGFFTTERPVRYVATISATTMPLASATYRGLGVIPVSRVRDVRKMRAIGVDVAAVNNSARQSLEAAFHDGDIVGVFPEGGVNDAPQMGTPRTGVAKMALEGLETVLKTDINADVALVPFGMQYEQALVPRSDVIVEVGEPFSLREWLATTSAPTPLLLSARLARAMRSVSRNSSTWGAAVTRDRLVAAVAAATGSSGQHPLDIAVAVQHRCALLVEGEERETIGATNDGVQWRTIADPIAEAVERAGGSVTSARDTVRVLTAAGHPSAAPSWPSGGTMLLMAPLALVGLALHWPLWRVVWRVAHRVAEVRTDPPVKAILPGLPLILCGYLLLGALFALACRAAGFSALWAIPSVMLLPRLGDLAMWWTDAVRILRLRARVRRWTAPEQKTLHEAVSALRTAWTALDTASPADASSTPTAPRS